MSEEQIPPADTEPANTFYSPDCLFCKAGIGHNRADCLASTQVAMKQKIAASQPEHPDLSLAEKRIELHRLARELERTFDEQAELISRQERLNSQIAILKLQLEGAL